MIKFEYRSLLANSAKSQYFQVNEYVFVEMLKHYGILDSSTYFMADLEIDIRETNSRGEGDLTRGKTTSLNRHKFLEMIFRIAKKKYMPNKICSTYAEAVQKLLNDHFIPHMLREYVNIWRSTRYWTEKTDNIYQSYFDIIYDTFTKYTGMLSKPTDKKKYM